MTIRLDDTQQHRRREADRKGERLEPGYIPGREPEVPEQTVKRNGQWTALDLCSALHHGGHRLAENLSLKR